MTFAIADTSSQLASDANGWQGSTLRNTMQGAIVQASGGTVRVKFKAGTLGVVFDSAKLNGVPLTFGGAPGASVSGGSSILSDWLITPIAAGTSVQVETHFTGTSTLARKGAADSSYPTDYKVDGQTGFTAGLSENYWFCGLELQDSGTPPPVISHGSRVSIIAQRSCNCLSGPVPSIPTNPNSSAPYLDTISALEWQDANVGDGAIVALGDSITRFGDWSQLGAVFNCGIGGEKIEGILNRVQTLTALHRALAVHLMIGVNNINNNEDMTTLQTRMGNLIDWLAGPLVITLVSYQATNTQKARTDAFNTAIRNKVSGRANCAVVDLNPIIAPSGLLLPQYSKDGLHWTPATYQVLFPLAEAAIRSVI